jgi:PAS domain S-box-containing protein
MTAVSLAVSGISILLLYQTALNEERARLVETAQSQARLLEAVARYDAVHNLDYPGGTSEATLSQMRDAHQNYTGFGQTGEFTLARREGDHMVFLLSHRHFDRAVPQPIPFDSELAEPMRRSLSGQSGTVIGLDYRGETVLAAYEPVAELDLGIVAKIDLAEVQAPFARTSLVAGLFVLAFVILGGLVFSRITNPLLTSIEESEARYRIVSELTSDYADSLRIEPDGSLVRDWVTGAFTRITGYAPDEIPGRDGWRHIVHPDDHPIFRRRLDKLLSGQPDASEYRILTKSGQVRWLQAYGRPVWGQAESAPDGNPGERVVGYIGAAKDVTGQVQAQEALRESHQRFLTVLDGIDAHIYAADIDTHEILFLNKPMRDLFGEDLVGKTCWRVFRAESAPCPHCTNEKLLDGAGESTGVHVWEGQNPLTGKWYANRDRAIKWIDGRHVRLQVATEITQLKLAEAALREYSERLEEMVEDRTQELREAQERLLRHERLAVLGQLAGGVGHELRTPLGAIKNAAYLLNMILEEPAPEVKETLEILHREVGSSERIISSLLDFARTWVPVRREVDINAVVRDVLSHIELPGHVEEIDQLDQGLPAIQADPDQLEQVFGNLILNAVQAMPDGGQLTVRTGQAAIGGRPSAVVTISDTGSGIPAENLDKLFEPLFTTKAKGIGLGLALAKTLVEANGGSTEVESEVGKGSTFTIRLPIDGETEKRPSASPARRPTISY